MALNIGENFKQRWLTAPEKVRQSYCDELKFISTLLEPDTQISSWQQQEIILKQRHRQITDQAYQKLKADVLAEQARQAEARRQKRQAELEQSLMEKRALEQEKIQEQLRQEQLKEQQQAEFLQQLAQTLAQEKKEQASKSIARFDVNRVRQFNQAIENTATSVDNLTDLPQCDDLKIRLELEAEYYIENTLQQLKAKLQAAAQEEIALILAQQQ